MHYHIHVKGHLDETWSDCLGGVHISHQQDGSTLLGGNFPDQTALVAVLNTLNDLNVTILCVEYTFTEQHDSQARPELYVFPREGASE
jgi:hypothetical protein